MFWAPPVIGDATRRKMIFVSASCDKKTFFVNGFPIRPFITAGTVWETALGLVVGVPICFLVDQGPHFVRLI